MAITKMSNSGIASVGSEKYNDMLAGNTAYAPSGMFSIASATATGGETSITLSSIPQTYKALHIRTNFRRNAAGGFQVGLRFNGDTGTNYAYQYAKGSGSAATYPLGSTINFIFGVDAPTNTQLANVWGVGIFDIDDYASTTKGKTVRYRGGFDNNQVTSAAATTGSGWWTTTSAITSITIYSQGDAFAAGSVVNLYGLV